MHFDPKKYTNNYKMRDTPSGSGAFMMYGPFLGQPYFPISRETDISVLCPRKLEPRVFGDNF